MAVVSPSSRRHQAAPLPPPTAGFERKITSRCPEQQIILHRLELLRHVGGGVYLDAESAVAGNFKRLCG